MKKQFPSLLSFISIAFLVILGCKKDDAPAPAPPPTKTQLISQSSWKFDHASASIVGDISNRPELACYIDNTMTFSSNLSGTISEGTVICSTPATSPFTWSFQSSETILHLSFTLFAGGSPDFTITTLTATNLGLSQQITLSGIQTTVEVTFKH